MAGFTVAGDIGARLEDLRRHLGLRQPAFAKLFGRGRKQASAWKSGRQAPPPAVLELAAEQNSWPLEIFAEGGPMPSTVLRPPVNRQSPNHRGTTVHETAEGPYVNPRARVAIDPPLGEQARKILEYEIAAALRRGKPVTLEELEEWLELVRGIAISADADADEKRERTRVAIQAQETALTGKARKAQLPPPDQRTGDQG